MYSGESSGLNESSLIKHVSRVLNWKKSDLVSGLELLNDEEELWCCSSGLFGFFKDTPTRAAPDYPETLQAEPAENKKELWRRREQNPL